LEIASDGTHTADDEPNHKSRKASEKEGTPDQTYNFFPAFVIVVPAVTGHGENFSASHTFDKGSKGDKAECNPESLYGHEPSEVTADEEGKDDHAVGLVAFPCIVSVAVEAKKKGDDENDAENNTHLS
jgi:hypothetical protein